MADDLRIIIQAELGKDKKHVDKLNKDIDTLAERVKSLKLNVDVDSNQIKIIKSQVDELKKKLSATQNLRILNKEDIKDGQIVVHSLDEAIERFGQLGKLKVSNKSLDPVTKEVTGFTLEIENANKQIEKLKFDLYNLADGNQINKVFTPVRINEIDNWSKMWDEAHKENERFNSDREKILQAEQKIRQAIDQNILKEKEKTEELEHQLQLYRQQAAINIQNASRRYEGLINLKDLEEYNKKVNSLTVDSPNVQREMKNLAMEFKQIETNARTAASAIDIANKSSISLGDAIRTAAVKFPLWVGISTIFYGSFRALSDLSAQIVEVDSQMTELNRVSENFNLEETLQESVLISEQLAVNLKDVNDAMIQASRMGLEGQDLYGLTRAAVLASSISDLTAEEALKNLSSTLVQFNMNASDAISIVDQLNAVDNDYISSTKDLSQSIAKSGAVAEDYGVSLQNLLGYTVAIQQATAESGNIIGNSIKSWVSRITTMDTAISELKNVGVDVFDPITGEVNKVEDILVSLASKWEHLTDTQRQNLAVIIAGRYHVSRFSGLMGNFSTVAEVANTALQGQGSAMVENLKYQQSLEGQLAKLTSSWTRFSVAIGESGLKDFFSTVIVASTNFMNSMAALVEVTDGWVLKIPAIVAGIYGLSKAFGALRVALMGLQLSAGWIGVLATGIGLLIPSLVSANTITGENTGELIENSQKLRDNADAIDALLDRYEALRPQAENNQAAHDELKEVMNQLQQIAPQLTGSLKEQGEVLNFNAEEARKYTESLHGMSNEILKATKDKIDFEIIGEEEELNNAKSRLDKFEEDYEKHQRKLTELHEAYGTERIEDLSNALDEAIGTDKVGRRVANDIIDFADIRKAMQESGYLDELMKIQEIEGNVKSLKERKKAVDELLKGTDKLNIAIGDESDETEEQSSAQDQLNDSISKTTDKLSSLSSAYQTLNEGEKLSADTLLELVSTYPELASYLVQTNDLTFNKGELIKQVAEVERQARIQEAQNALDAVENTKKELEDKQTLYSQFYNNMLNSSLPMDNWMRGSVLTEEELARLDEANKKSDELRSKIKILSQPLDFYSGAGRSKSSSSKKKEKTPAELHAEAIEKAYDHSVDYIEQMTRMQDLNANDQLYLWKKLEQSHKEYLQSNQEAYEDYVYKIKTLEEQIVEDKFNLSKDYIEREKYYNRMSLEDELAAWLRVQARYIEGSKEWEEVNREIFRVENEIYEQRNREQEEALKLQQELYDEWLKNTEDVADKAIDMIKDALEEAKDAALDAIDEEMDAEDKRHDRRMDNLDDELDKYNDIIDEIEKSLDRETEERDFNKELEKLREEELEIRRQINELSLDDSAEATAKKEELEEDLADKTEEIEELKYDRTVQLRRDNLDDLRQTKEKEIEEERKAEEEKYDKVIDRLERQKEAETEYWESILENEEYFAELRQDIIEGNLDDIDVALDGFKDNVNSQMDLIGKGITENLIDKLEEAKDLLDDLDYDVSKPKKSDNNSKNNESKTTSKEQYLWEEYLDNKKKAEAIGNPDDPEFINLNQRNEYLRRQYGFQDGSYDDLKDVKKFKSGGFTGNSQGLAWLDEQELVLKDVDTKNILSVVDIVRNIVDKFNMSNLNSMMSPRNQETSNAPNVFNFEKLVHVDKIEKNADIDYLMNQLDRKFRQLGFVMKSP